MDLFRDSNFVEKGSHYFKNFVLNYAYTNYVRSKKKISEFNYLCIYYNEFI